MVLTVLKTMKNKELKICNEKLFHFNCADCMKWWTIGDADEKREFWYCPWCGKKQSVSNKDKGLSIK